MNREASRFMVRNPVPRDGAAAVHVRKPGPAQPGRCMARRVPRTAKWEQVGCAGASGGPAGCRAGRISRELGNLRCAGRAEAGGARSAGGGAARRAAHRRGGGTRASGAVGRARRVPRGPDLSRIRRLATCGSGGGRRGAERGRGEPRGGPRTAKREELGRAGASDGPAGCRAGRISREFGNSRRAGRVGRRERGVTVWGSSG